ncbi:MAG: hypothetical protein AAF539_10095, partial [Planctomycetota bacterium]
LETSSEQALSALAGLKSRKEALLNKRLDLIEKLEQLNADEVDLGKLTWEADLAEREYLFAAQKRDNAKMVRDLAEGDVNEVAIVQDATLGLKKVKPKRSILSVLACMVAFGIGLLQAIVRGLVLSPTVPDDARARNRASRSAASESRAVRQRRFDMPHKRAIEDQVFEETSLARRSDPASDRLAGQSRQDVRQTAALPTDNHQAGLVPSDEVGSENASAATGLPR